MTRDEGKLRFELILSLYAPAEGNIDFDDFLRVRSEFNKLMGEMASEARCEHPVTYADGTCKVCGRKPNEWNTKPKQLSIPESIDKLRKEIP